jgi:hypothetical protein
MVTIAAYIGAAIAEIAGCFAFWAWLRLDKSIWWLAPGVVNLAQLLQATNRLAEAEPMMRCALAIFEASLGPDHPNTQGVQRNLDALLARIAQS